MNFYAEFIDILPPLKEWAFLAISFRNTLHLKPFQAIRNDESVRQILRKAAKQQLSPAGRWFLRSEVIQNDPMAFQQIVNLIMWNLLPSLFVTSGAIGAYNWLSDPEEQLEY